jgi:predicted metal-dependent HD superfamily phosphohydrolase
MIQWLQNYWQDLVSEYTDDAMVNSLWKDIRSHYTSKDRNYHNLSHLYNMFLLLEDIKTKIEDLDSLKFAIWYHDIIYKSINKDNEEQSANFVEKVLKSFNFDDSRVKKIRKLILSTKKHELLSVENNDNAYLLDLDLSILGTDWETYQLYIQSIRKEYKIYPNILYKPGRKKVLKHFLERESLYFTEQFKIKFEKQARENLKKEIELL